MVESAPFPSLLSSIVDNRGRTCPTAESGLALIATNCVKNSALYPSYEKVRFVTQDTFEKWFRGHPRPGDLLLVTKGSPGQVCVVPDPVDFCIAQDMVAVRANEEAVYPPYLFAALRSKVVQDQIENMHVGTLIPHFKKGDFGRLFIPLPDRHVQQMTGDLYLQLSLKIDLNRRMSATLDAIARAIFKDWFVDFGPIRAKMEGRDPPGLTSEIAALFPDRLGDDGLPNGWRLASVYDFTDVVYGAPFASSLFNGEKRGLPLIRIRDLSDHSPKVFTAEAHPKATVINPGDIVVGMDAEFRLHVWNGPRSVLNQRVCHFRPKKMIPKSYVAEALKEPLSFQERGKVGTTVIHLGKSDIDTFLLLRPSDEVLKAFGDVTEPLMERVVANAQESQTLATLRDHLLPKLMSGEIRTSDAEKLVEKSAA